MEKSENNRTPLQAARHQRHWTLSEAAERIGCDADTLKRGKMRPRSYFVQRLCEVYEAKSSELDLEQVGASGWLCVRKYYQ